MSGASSHYDTPKYNTQADRALRLADEMRIHASQIRQMGFPLLAKELNRNVDQALKWAAKQA